MLQHRLPWPGVLLAVSCAVCAAEQVTLELQYDTEAPLKAYQAFYWFDAAGNPYSSEYQRGFTYASAKVSLTYETPTRNPLRGRIVGSGLKPNFAYQLKMEGKPTALYGQAGDDAGNEKIGFAGRWWREKPNPANARDADYLRDRAKPNHVYLGYLLFGYVMTDCQGELDAEIAVDSSFHVLWQEGQQHKRREQDGPVVRYVLTVPFDDPRYEVVVPESTVGVYGETEPGRALPGQLRLAPGSYDTRLIVTEESWHKINPGWASILRVDSMKFDILPE